MTRRKKQETAGPEKIHPDLEAHAVPIDSISFDPLPVKDHEQGGSIDAIAES